MPTGYTADVVDGKVTEFKDFALICARAFGALISMRDEPLDRSIPDEIAPSDYYAERLSEDQKRLGDVLAMSNKEAEDAAAEAYAAALKSRTDYLARQEQEAERINSMLVHVRTWTPPTTDHNEMKKFMIEQLTISLPGNYAPAIPERLDGETWRKREGDRLAEAIVSDKDELAKENKRAADRTAWIRALKSSLLI